MSKKSRRPAGHGSRTYQVNAAMHDLSEVDLRLTNLDDDDGIPLLHIEIGDVWIAVNSQEFLTTIIKLMKKEAADHPDTPFGQAFVARSTRIDDATMREIPLDALPESLKSLFSDLMRRAEAEGKGGRKADEKEGETTVDGDGEEAKSPLGSF